MATHSQTAEEVLASSLEAKARGVRRALQQSRAEGVDRFVRLVSVAVADEMLAGSRAARGRQAIRRLLTTLRLSYDDTGRMLGTSGETVRRWATGQAGLSAEKLALLDIATQALGRLQRLFRPDRLPEVVRRPAESFGGQRALDWILQGRIREVADSYEQELAYQL